VDRRRLALVALVVFAVATAVASAVSGSRPGSAPGIAPFVVQVVGYGCALVAGLALLRSSDRPMGADRRLGGTVLVAVGVLAVLDVEAFAGEAGGANIGAGFLRLICLVVIVAVAGRLVVTTVTAAGRRRRP
jgi:peptidoglycan/LPS O-acetylase OafA/YrhL